MRLRLPGGRAPYPQGTGLGIFLSVEQLQTLSRHAFQHTRNRASAASSSAAWAHLRQCLDGLELWREKSASRPKMAMQMGQILWAGLEAWAYDYLPSDFLHFEEAVVDAARHAVDYTKHYISRGTWDAAACNLSGHLHADAQVEGFNIDAFVALCFELDLTPECLWDHLWP